MSGPVHLLTLGCWLWAMAASACPFCGVVGRPLAQRRDEAAVVAVAEAAGEAAPDADGLPRQTFRIDQLLRGAGLAADALVTARVAGPVPGTAILFGAPAAGDLLEWTAVGADETLLGYVVAAPAWKAPAATRLEWFANRLEHPDPAIAEDAFTEFGLAPFTAVAEAAQCFDADRLRAWVTEPGIDQRRRGFYGLALGLVAARADDPAGRAAAITTLHEAIAQPADDFRAGLDGLMAGLLVAEGETGLAFLARLGCARADGRPVDQRHLLAALRFAAESLGDSVPRERVAAVVARLLQAPAVAAEAAIDLARWQAWDHAADVAALWDTLGRDDPLVRRAVAGYLTACPQPAARRLLEGIRSRDPGRLDAAIEASRLPK